MNDTTFDAAQLNLIAGFSSAQLARLLSLVTMELTIAGRETYVPGSLGVEDPTKLRALNECQHFLLGILRRVLFDSEVDAASLTKSLISLAGDELVGKAVQAALWRSMRQLGN